MITARTTAQCSEKGREISGWGWDWESTAKPGFSKDNGGACRGSSSAVGFEFRREARSEGELNGVLDLSWSSGMGGLAKAIGDSSTWLEAGNHVVGRTARRIAANNRGRTPLEVNSLAARIHVAAQEVRPVESVEELEAELNFQLFSRTEVLVERQVRIYK